MRLILHKAILGPDYVKIALYGRPPEIGPFSEAQKRFQTSDWLPWQMSESVVLWDAVERGDFTFLRKERPCPHDTAAQTGILSYNASGGGRALSERSRTLDSLVLQS